LGITLTEHFKTTIQLCRHQNYVHGTAYMNVELSQANGDN